MNFKFSHVCTTWPNTVPLSRTKTKYTLYLNITIYTNRSSCNQSRKHSYDNWFRIHLVYAEWITRPVQDKQTHANNIFGPLYRVQIFVIYIQSLFILWNRWSFFVPVHQMHARLHYKSAIKKSAIISTYTII